MGTTLHIRGNGSTHKWGREKGPGGMTWQGNSLCVV